MPLKGSGFRFLNKLRKDRERHNREHEKQEKIHLEQLKKTRSQEESRTLIREQIRAEKERIKKARQRRSFSYKLGSALVKSANANARKQLKRSLKPKRKRARRKPRRRCRRKR